MFLSCLDKLLFCAINFIFFLNIDFSASLRLNVIRLFNWQKVSGIFRWSNAQSSGYTLNSDQGLKLIAASQVPMAPKGGKDKHQIYDYI